MNSTLRLTGIGLRSPHIAEFLERQLNVPWVEVHSENYFAAGGNSLHQLDRVREQCPVSLHGVGLSLGSCDEMNWLHLRKLRDLVTRVDPCLVSEHLCWSSIDGQYLHDLLPLPYTEEALTHVVNRIQQVQTYLQRQILIENVSGYITYHESVMPEHEFLVEVAKQSGCGILLDINNLYVSAYNLGINAEAYLAHIPKDLVQEIHLAGFTSTKIDDKDVLIDSHNRSVANGTWELFTKATKQLGVKPTMIEWDQDLPSIDRLLEEAHKAETIIKDAYVTTKCAS